jgi:hypothetical protein
MTGNQGRTMTYASNTDSDSFSFPNGGWMTFFSWLLNGG